MKILLIFFLLINSLLANDSLFHFSNESLINSKYELQKIHHDHQKTIYCDCSYNYEDMNHMIDRESCGYIPRIDSVNEIRDNRIEWEHIMPVPFIFSKYGQEKSLKLYVVKS